MNMFFTAQESPADPPPAASGYDEVMATVKDLAVKLDNMATDYASRITDNNSEIAKRQEENAVLTTKETEAKEMSAKLKDLALWEAPEPKADVTS